MWIINRTFDFWHILYYIINAVKKYCVVCGIEDMHFHVLQHTFATRCVEVGFEMSFFCFQSISHIPWQQTFSFCACPCQLSDALCMQHWFWRRLSDMFAVYFPVSDYNCTIWQIECPLLVQRNWGILRWWELSSISWPKTKRPRI